VLVAVSALIKLAQNADQSDKAWQEAARKLGLEAGHTGWLGTRRMSGTLDGFSVYVDTATTTHGKSSSTTTRFQIGFPEPLGLGLELSREGLATQLAKLFGQNEVLTGDGPFDAAVLARGDDADEIRAYLTDRRRDAIRRFITKYEGARVYDSGVFAAVPRTVAKSAELVETVRDLVEVAQVASAKGKKTRTTRPPVAASDTSPQTAPSAAPARVKVDALSAAAVCESLFKDSPASIEATRRFDEQFKGKTVHWTGTLKWVDSAAFEPSYGFDTVARAIIEIGSTGPTPGASPVRAFVRLPDGLPAGLREKAGTQVAFTGRLVGLDAFARNIYVDGGAVEPPSLSPGAEAMGAPPPARPGS
jgi:hypothetical protein